MEIKNKINKETVIKLSKDKNEPEWLLNKRLEALEFLKNNELPTFKYGISIKTDVEDLKNIEVKPELNSYKNTVENKDNIIIKTFDEALKSHENELKKHLMSSIKMNALTALHLATLTNGLLIIIPKNTELKQPIITKSLMENQYQATHTIIILEENSNASIIQSHESNCKDKLNYKSNLVEIFLNNGSILHYSDIQNLNQNVINYTIKEGTVNKDAKLNWLDCAIGSKLTISSINSQLAGQGSSTMNYGLFLGTNKQQFDLNVSAVHAAPNSFSDLVTKGTLDHESKNIYRGLVKINPNAEGSNGYQKEDTLILSENAESDAIPNLEIGNNDVKCSHGATIGQVDKEKLFYMMSRGIPKNQAVNKFVEGFFEPMIGKIESQHIKEDLRKVIHKKLHS